MLLVLAEAPAHGWDVARLLGPLGHEGVNHGHAYRMLRAMEHDGLVVSRWDPSPAGPPRRVYSTTDAGRRWAAAASELLRHADVEVAGFLRRYERLSRAPGLHRAAS